MQVETAKQKDNAVARDGGNIVAAVESIERDQNGFDRGGMERSISSSRAPQRVMAGVKTCSSLHGDMQTAAEMTAAYDAANSAESLRKHKYLIDGIKTDTVPPIGNDREHNQVKSANVSVRENAEATTGGNAGGAVESGAKRQTAARLVGDERSSSVSLAPDGSTEHKAMTRSDLRSDAETRGETTRAPALAGGNSTATRATSSEDGGRPRSGVDGVLNDGERPGVAQAAPGVALFDEELVWFAGIFDGEGSCGLRVNKGRKANVAVSFAFGLVNREAVEIARSVVMRVVPGCVPTLHSQKSKLSERLLYLFHVAKKEHAYCLGAALVPHLRVKRTEVLLSLSFLTRALLGRTTGRHYQATQLDLDMVEVVRQLKRGIAGARERGLRLLAEHPPALDVAAIIDPQEERWRELRSKGASVGAIARHFGVTHYIVKRATSGITPERRRSALELGLTPVARFNALVAAEDIESWRREVAEGTSARQVALKYGSSPQYVVEATSDVRFTRRSGAVQGAV